MGKSMKMEYYNLRSQWSKVRPHLNEQRVRTTLQCDLHKYTYGAFGRPFLEGNLPCEYGEKEPPSHGLGRRPAFFDYVLLGACHWLVNFELELARRVEPEKQWRIITSEKHSTVWDGGRMLFEFNYLALKIDPNVTFKEAYDKVLKPGIRLRTDYAQHHSIERLQAIGNISV